VAAYAFEDFMTRILAAKLTHALSHPQADRSNYFHPLGFAYFADGAHDEKDELEPGIVPPGSSSTCGEDNSCPAPMYFIDGEYQGKYSNLPVDEAANQTVEISRQGELADDDFGLDSYEPKFFYPLGDWLEFGTFEILVRFDVADFEADFFYFCHVSYLCAEDSGYHA
jgi:hypothetical protein